MKNITEKEFVDLTAFIKTKYGINLSQKKTLVVGRLQNHLIKNKFESFSEYYNYVNSDRTGAAVAELVNILSTNHTFFMREADHFDYFKLKVLPHLAVTETEKKDLRIWSAGCSSGEEPYTLAMILSDFFGPNKALWDTKVLATDISTKVLDVALKAVFPSEGLVGVPEQWKKNYFVDQKDGYSGISEKIKNDVIFRKFNLMNEVFPFKKKFHVIFCRNVMMYFDEKTKMELINKYYEHTEYGGYLFIGHSESINRGDCRYKYIMPAVYKKE